MQPNSPPNLDYQGPNPTPQQPPTDPFAFINEAKKPSPFRGKLNFSFSASSIKVKLLASLVGLLVLILLIVAIKAVFSGSASVDLNSLYAVLGEEQELTNLASIGAQNAASQSYLNFSYTSLGSTTTDQTKLTKLLKTNGIVLNPKNIILQPNLDTQLNQALQLSSFDATYAGVMQQQLGVYLNDLTQAYSLNKSSIVKTYLSQDYQNTKLLVKMLSSSSG